MQKPGMFQLEIKLPQTQTYEGLEFIDQGATASVFRVRHRLQNKEYALKKVNMSTKDKQSKALQDEIIYHKLYLPNHPNILKANDIFQSGNSICMVMDLCSTTLDSIIVDYKEVPLWFKMRVARQLTTGLDVLFERSIIHRDIKPKNILLQGSNYSNYIVKIGDFGLARRLALSVDFTTHAVGTPLYMAPEIPQHQKFKIDVDVWALGCLIFALFVGDPPFNAPNWDTLYQMHRIGDYKYPRGTHIPVEAVNFIDHCLRHKPEERTPVYKLLEHQFLTTGDEKMMHPVKSLLIEPLTINIYKNNEEQMHSLYHAQLAALKYS